MADTITRITGKYVREWKQGHSWKDSPLKIKCQACQRESTIYCGELDAEAEAEVLMLAHKCLPKKP